jgi:penicillin V acylase-like amidase (Ntn superfamily)
MELLVCVFTIAGVAFACSRVLWNVNGQAVVVARSSDWIQPMGEMLVIYPRDIKVRGDAGENSLEWISKYGSIGVVTYGLTLKNLDRDDGTQQDPLIDWNLEGMNEKGLAAHLLYLPGTKYEKEDKRPGIIYSRWVRYILDNFGTVKDAVRTMQKVRIVPVGIGGVVHPVHLAIDDPTGDSAIMELIDGQLVIHHGPEYTVMTNQPFYPAQLANLNRYKPFGGRVDDLPGGIEPAERFVRAAVFLKTLPDPNDDAEAVAYLYSLIRNVSVPFGASVPSGPFPTMSTWWTTVSDLKERMFYFHWTSKLNVLRIDLNKVDFSAMKRLKALDPKRTNLAGDVTEKFASAPMEN